MNRELDARVAREVMGKEPVPEFTFPPPYSTDMNAAMEVVAKMREQGWLLYLETRPADKEDMFLATFWKKGIGTTESYFNDTPASAICLAALDAVSQK